MVTKVDSSLIKGLSTTNDLVFEEKSDHSETIVAGNGYLWVRDDTPNVLVFTDDAGTDTVLGSGGGGTPAGADTQIQYNNAGAFGANAALTYNSTTDTLTLGDGSVANPTINLNGTGVGNPTIEFDQNGTEAGYVRYNDSFAQMHIGGSINSQKVAILAKDSGGTDRICLEAGGGNTGIALYHNGLAKFNTQTYGVSIPVLNRLQLAASATSSPSMNMPSGAAPTVPIEGDFWITGADLFCRLGGVNQSLTGGGGGGATFRIIDDDGDTIVETEATAAGDQDTVRIRLNVGGTDDTVGSFANAATTIKGRDLTGGAGGTLNLQGGDGYTGGTGGAVAIRGGNTTGGAGPGGAVTIYGGNSGAGDSQYGGDITIQSGQSNGTYSGSAVNIYSGSGGDTSGYGGPISIYSGSGNGGAGYYGGNVSIAAGNDGAGTTAGGSITLRGGGYDGSGVGGNVVLTPGGGTSSAGAVEISQTTAPTVTTNKLYNVSGTLFWNGTDLTAGGTPSGIQDGDGDTSIETDTGDDDFIRFDTGVAPAGFPANTNTMTLASSGLTLTLPTANVATTEGAPINMYAGQGNTTGAGGYIGMYGGVGGATGDGGFIYLEAGEGGATSGNGGDVQIVGGRGDNNTGDRGGSVSLFSGAGNTDDEDGSITMSIGDSGVVDILKGYKVINSTGSSALVATIPLQDNVSHVFEIFAVAREDSGTESAAFRIFGGVEDTSDTASLIGNVQKDRTDDGGASADWDVIVGVSAGNLTISVDNDAETVDWKIKIHYHGL